MRVRWLWLCLFVFLVKDAQAEPPKRNLKQAQEYFKDILLVIFYANPHFETIEFEKQLYAPVFKNMVFYGDRTKYVDIGEADHEYEDGDHGNFRIVYTRNGYYLTRWIKDVLLDYPGYTGYIFMQDDVLMQFWNFLDLDKNKLWFSATNTWHPHSEPYPAYTEGESQKKFMTINRITDPKYDTWFNSGCGMPEIQKIFGQLPLLGFDDEQAKLVANFKENGAAHGFVDLFYIPGCFSEKILPLCDLFDRVFCELAIPTIFGAVDYIKNWEELPNWWNNFNDGEPLKAAYEPKYFWMHPLKYSKYEDNRNFALRVFHEQFYDVLEDK